MNLPIATLQNNLPALIVGMALRTIALGLFEADITLVVAKRL